MSQRERILGFLATWIRTWCANSCEHYGCGLANWPRVSEAIAYSVKLSSLRSALCPVLYFSTELISWATAGRRSTWKGTSVPGAYDMLRMMGWCFRWGTGDIWRHTWRYMEKHREKNRILYIKVSEEHDSTYTHTHITWQHWQHSTKEWNQQKPREICCSDMWESFAKSRSLAKSCQSCKSGGFSSFMLQMIFILPRVTMIW